MFIGRAHTLSEHHAGVPGPGHGAGGTGVGSRDLEDRQPVAHLVSFFFRLNTHRNSDKSDSITFPAKTEASGPEPVPVPSPPRAHSGFPLRNM